MIQYQDISHLAMEVTDLDRAEQFYGKALGMETVCRDNGELGQGPTGNEKHNRPVFASRKSKQALSAIPFLRP